MAKRFIDNEIFRKRFVRGLKAPHKLLWVYMFCECDIAGIWDIDLEAAGLYCGAKFTMGEFKNAFGSKVYFFANDTKAFIPDFIEFQYPKGLQESNPAHKNIFIQLSKYQLIDVLEKAPIEGLQSPSEGTKVMVMDMYKDMDMEEERGDTRGDWRTDFDLYLEMVRQAYAQLSGALSEEQQKYYPNLDIPLTLEKACVNYWATLAGWKKKKASRGDPDWKRTFTNALSQPQNKVYNEQRNNQSSPGQTTRREERKHLAAEIFQRNGIGAGSESG